MTERIRWEPTKYGGWTGDVGTIDQFVFQLWQPGSPEPSPWRLDSNLPGDFGRVATGTDPGKLKAEAEQWLERFVASLGAIFPDPPAKPSRAWHADWTVTDRDQAGNAIIRYEPTGGLYRILPVEES